MGEYGPKRRKIPMEGGARVPKEPPKPDERSVVYDRNTGEGIMCHTHKERYEKLDSGEYVDSPADIGYKEEEIEELAEEESAQVGIFVEQEKKPVFELADDVNYASMLKFRDPGLPPPKRYMTRMTVAELIALGKEWGLEFDEKDPPTKLDMRKAIKEAAEAKGKEVV